MSYSHDILAGQDLLSRNLEAPNIDNAGNGAYISNGKGHRCPGGSPKASKSSSTKNKKTLGFFKDEVSEWLPKAPSPKWKTFAPRFASKPKATSRVKKNRRAGRPKGFKNNRKLPPLYPPRRGAKYTDKLRSADRYLDNRQKFLTLPY